MRVHEFSSNNEISLAYLLGGGEEFKKFEEEILDDLEEEIDYDDNIWEESDEEEIEEGIDSGDDTEDEDEFEDLEEIDDLDDLGELEELEDFDEDGSSEFEEEN